MTRAYGVADSACPFLRSIGLGLVPVAPPDAELAMRWAEKHLPYLPKRLVKDDRIIPRFMRRKRRTTTWPIYDEVDGLRACGDRAVEARILEEVRKLDPTVKSVTITQRMPELLGTFFHDFVVEVTATFVGKPE